MHLRQKVEAVEAVFVELDVHLAAFQSRSGLYCKAGCGKCCTKPDIEATTLEFLPFAFYLYKQGKLEEWYEEKPTDEAGLCRLLDTSRSAGMCSQYPFRGLICRLFGYSARINKYSMKEMVTCQIIKTEQAENFNLAVEGIHKGEDIPVMKDYYAQLQSIDPDLTWEFYPISVAIRKALELVMHLTTYQVEE